MPVTYNKQDNLPLRGSLICDCCGKKLTGSASKGNGGKYYYYHCGKGCKRRFKVNNDFEKTLSKIKVNKSPLKAYYEIIREGLKNAKNTKGVKLRKINETIEKK